MGKKKNRNKSKGIQKPTNSSNSTAEQKSLLSTSVGVESDSDTEIQLASPSASTSATANTSTSAPNDNIHLDVSGSSQSVASQSHLSNTSFLSEQTQNASATELYGSESDDDTNTDDKKDVTNTSNQPKSPLPSSNFSASFGSPATSSGSPAPVFIPGTVDDQEDSFFDAVAKSIFDQKITGHPETGSSIRKACARYLEDTSVDHSWIKTALNLDEAAFVDYRSRLRHTKKQLDNLKAAPEYKGSSAIIGSPQVEGRLICKMLASIEKGYKQAAIRVEIKQLNKQPKERYIDSEGPMADRPASGKIIHISSTDAQLYRPLLQRNNRPMSHVIDINSDPANDAKSSQEPNGNRFVYTTVKGVAYGSLGLEAFYETFNFYYLVKALEKIVDITGIDPTFKMAAIPLAAFLTMGDTGANFTQFDAGDQAEKFSKKLPDGFIVGTGQYLKKCFGSIDGFVTVGIPTLSMVINFPIGAWADVEAIWGWLDEHMGAGKWVVLAGVEILGPAYYVFFSGEDTLNGVDFYLNRGEQRLSPPQQSVWTKFWKDGEYSTAIQVEIERTLQNFSRSISFGFLGGRLVEQLLVGETDPNDPNANQNTDWRVLLGQAVAYGATYLQCHLSRGPKAYQKYMGNKDLRLDLVTLREARERKKDVYGNMAWSDYILKELDRFMSPLPLATTAAASYFTAKIPGAISALSSVEALAGWPLEYAMPITLAILSSSALYFGIYRQANVNLEMRKMIAIEQKLRAMAEEEKEKAEVILDRFSRRSDLSPNDQLLKRAAEELLKKFEAKYGDNAAEAAESSIGNNNSAENSQSNNENKAEAKTDPQPSKSCGERLKNTASSVFSIASLGTFFAVSTQLSRTLLSIPQTLGVLQKNTGISDRDGAILAATTASTVQFSASSFNYMKDKSTETMEKAKKNCCAPNAYQSVVEEEKTNDTEDDGAALLRGYEQSITFRNRF